MSAFLGRPRIVDHRRCDIVLPSQLLDESDVTPGPPSPFAQFSLQTGMIQRLSEAFPHIDEKFSLSQILAFRQIVQDWMNELPKVYSTNSPDTRWDSRHGHVVWQRRNLHVIGYLTMLYPSKACLVHNTGIPVPDGRKEQINIAVECLSLLVSAWTSLLKIVFPDHAKYDFAIFCYFESTISLLTTIDKDGAVGGPRRDVLTKAIESLVQVLERLKYINRAWIKSHALLTILADTRAAGEKALRPPCSNANHSGPKSPEPSSPPESLAPLDASPAPSPFIPEPLAFLSSTAMIVARAVAGDPPRQQGWDLTTYESAGAPKLRTRTPKDYRRDFARAANRRHSVPSPLPLLSSKPVFDVFLEHFLDSYGPRETSTSSTPYWMQTQGPYQVWRAGVVAMASSPLVCNAYKVVSTAYYGLSVRDQRLVRASAKLYTSVLKSLLMAIYHPEQSKSDAVLITVLLCGAYEVSSVDKFMRTVLTTYNCQGSATHDGKSVY